MNKLQLIEALAEQTEVSKSVSAKVLDAFVTTVTNTLSKGDEVALTGFGKFTVSARAARTGRDPRSGNPIEISARNVPAFKAGKELKDAVNCTSSVEVS